MAKFKFKGTTIDDVDAELERLKEINTTEIPLNHILKLTTILHVEYLPSEGRGSQIRFRHSALENLPQYTHGYFSVHRSHKGGDQVAISKVFFKQYLYRPLKEIIRILKQENQ